MDVTETWRGYLIKDNELYVFIACILYCYVAFLCSSLVLNKQLIFLFHIGLEYDYERKQLLDYQVRWLTNILPYYNIFSKLNKYQDYLAWIRLLYNICYIYIRCLYTYEYNKHIKTAFVSHKDSYNVINLFHGNILMYNDLCRPLLTITMKMYLYPLHSGKNVYIY